MKRCKLCSREILDETAEKFNGMGEECMNKYNTLAQSAGWAMAYNSKDTNFDGEMKFRKIFNHEQEKDVLRHFEQAKKIMAQLRSGITPISERLKEAKNEYYKMLKNDFVYSLRFDNYITKRLNSANDEEHELIIKYFLITDFDGICKGIVSPINFLETKELIKPSQRKLKLFTKFLGLRFNDLYESNPDRFLKNEKVMKIFSEYKEDKTLFIYLRFFSTFFFSNQL